MSATRVSGDRVVGLGPCVLAIGARGDVRLEPAFAGCTHERLGFVGGEPCRIALDCRIDEVAREPFHHQIPADADGARTELLEVVLADAIDVRDVLEREACPRGSFEGESDGHPADAAAELPGDVERRRWLAARDRAARVALDLVGATELERSLDRPDPAGDALARGHRVP